MKLPQLKQENGKARFTRTGGFTMVEMMTAMLILTFTIAALLSAHIMGLKQNQLIESKAGASDSSRRAVNNLVSDIRRAKMWFIGNISGSTFINKALFCASISASSLQSANGDAPGNILVPTIEIPNRKGVQIAKFTRTGTIVSTVGCAMTTPKYTGSNGTNPSNRLWL